jgi:hypothetical protein
MMGLCCCLCCCRSRRQRFGKNGTNKLIRNSDEITFDMDDMVEPWYRDASSAGSQSMAIS